MFANSSCILQIHVENEASLVPLLVELIINLWQGFILQAVVAKFFLRKPLAKGFILVPLWKGQLVMYAGI